MAAQVGVEENGSDSFASRACINKLKLDAVSVVLSVGFSVGLSEGLSGRLSVSVAIASCGSEGKFCFGGSSFVAGIAGVFVVGTVVLVLSVMDATTVLTVFVFGFVERELVLLLFFAESPGMTSWSSLRNAKSIGRRFTGLGGLRGLTRFVVAL